MKRRTFFATALPVLASPVLRQSRPLASAPVISVPNVQRIPQLDWCCTVHPGSITVSGAVNIVPTSLWIAPCENGPLAIHSVTY
jgi:hypothetical protein